MKKHDANPMHSAHSAPRCCARSKRTGLPCRAPAVSGWRVCRMHGARGGAPEGAQNGAWRHGERGQDAVEQRREVAGLVALVRELAHFVH
jgi:hypothetical protein